MLHHDFYGNHVHQSCASSLNLCYLPQFLTTIVSISDEALVNPKIPLVGSCVHKICIIIILHVSLVMQSFKKAFMKLYLFLKYSLGEDASLPAQSATVVTLIDDSISEGHEGVFSSSAKHAEVKFVYKKRVSSDDVLKMQFECLYCKKENFLLKKQKLQL